jgi:hypothetical protein
VIDNTLLRICETKKTDVTLGWRKLHYEPQDLLSSPNIIRELKSSRMGWVEHVAGIVVRNTQNVLVEKPKRNNSPEMSLHIPDKHVNMDIKIHLA